MPAIVTDDPIYDAIENVVTAINNNKATWGIGSVDDYPSWEVGKHGDAVAVEFINWRLELAQVSHPVAEIDHLVAMRVWYFSKALKPQVAYRNIYNKLSKIVLFFLTNPNPNGYGELLINQQAFGPETQEVVGAESSEGHLIGCAFTLLHTKTKQHTLTLV